MPILLAHGALGAWDELVFVGIAIVFVGMMAFSWLRSQQVDDEDAAQNNEHFELE